MRGRPRGGECAHLFACLRSRFWFFWFGPSRDARGPAARTPSGEKDEIQVQPFASTRMLSAAALDALVADEGGRLRFSGTPAELTDIAVDAVIVAGISDASPRGLCRIVTGVSSAGGDLLLDTADVPSARFPQAPPPR